ncbi:MAG: hypothetical protein NVSMB48_09640 [Marmoricola sp.]|jgi:hypothetical protein|uniref:hypothetical protein n=1 Tax=Nocardioides sp. Root140 TaxID=1736460 RepID=UPI0006F94C3F|nr:hypothetical protein [Nocardioides sp. Root140]KQY49556.1 hypothetical protein ASD30_22635 [Nocardioides sp. Root140]
MTDHDRLRSLPIHIPLVRTVRSQQTDDGGRLHAARCSCGEWGPFVDSREIDPIAALVRQHGVTEPTACADCGHVTPVDPTKSPEWRAPWRRYQPVEDDGTWRYVCSDRAACQQRQLAPPRETDSDPLTAVVGGWSTFTVSLDLSGEWAHTVGGLDEAITNFQHVRANCPRRWDQIGPEDRRALTALVAAVEAIQEAVDAAQDYAPLPALKAGATWSDLAAATGEWTAEECRDAYLERVDSMDWPEREDAEIRSLLDDD